MRIGIYGGSFNPVHNGHVTVARKAVAELGLDTLLVVPAKVSPFKVENAPSGGYDRLRLCRLAFAEIPEAVVDDRELRRGGVSYSIITVREIRAENPDAEIFFIIGEDSVEGLPRWRDYDELKRLCAFKSYPRTPESSTEVRRRLAAGDPIDNLVPPSVAAVVSPTPSGRRCRSGI